MTRFPVATKRGPVWFYPIMHPAYILRLAEEQQREESAALPIFQSDLQRFFSGVDKWEAPYVHSDIQRNSVTIAHTADEAHAIIAKMAVQQPVGIDIETSSKRPYESDLSNAYGSKIITAAISDGKHTVAFPCEHPEAPNTWGLEVLLEVLLTRRWIAHNAAFELGWFQWTWPDYQFQPFDDSMALGRLYHQRNSILALDDLTMVHLGVNVKKIVPVDASNIMAYPLSDVLLYNGLDALGSALVYQKIRNKVNEDNYQRILVCYYRYHRHGNTSGYQLDLALSADLKNQNGKPSTRDINTTSKHPSSSH